jgi:N-acetylmuramoyl-L-alanine amidase
MRSAPNRKQTNWPFVHNLLHTPLAGRSMRKCFLAGLLSLLCISPILSTKLFGAESLTVYTDTQSKTLPMTLVDGQKFVSLLDLLLSVGAVNVTERSASMLQVKVEKHSLSLRPNSTLVGVDGTLASLSEPVLVVSSVWLVPTEFINKVLPRLTDRKVTYRPGANRAFVTTQPPPRLVLEAGKGIVSTRLALDLSQVVPFELKRDGKQMSISLGNRPVDFAVEKLNYSDDQIKSIVYDDSDARPKLRITLASSAVDVKASIAQEGHVFVAVISRAEAVPQSLKPQQPAPQVSTGARAASEAAIPSGTARVGLRTVTIDVGHGGVDNGAIAIDNLLMEKNLVLEIARRLRFILQSRMGLQVYLTREGDADVSLDQRAILANVNHSDVFLSLHAGFSLVQDSSAPRVYVYAPVKDSAVPDAQPQNFPASGTLEESPERKPLVHEYFSDWRNANAGNFQMNLTLAEIIESELAPLWKKEPLPPRIAPLRPLANVLMPAVEVEVGNLNSEADAKQLLDSQFQTSIARAIASALERFKPIYEVQVKNAPTP